MEHIVNINQHEPLKMMQHVPVMVAMRTMFASHYSIFLRSFFPLLLVIFSQTMQRILFLLVAFLPLFEQQFPSNFSSHAVQPTPFWIATL